VEDDMTDLYDRDITGPFQALCGGGDNKDGSMEDCLEIAPLDGGGYAVRDTKLGDESPELRFDRAELINLGEKAIAGLL
jgi:hypothetical protein